MNPAYQGQLDVFCAAYAVINAMRHINAARLLTCRAILHEALLDAARDEESFCALLDQRTDYVDWVDAMLSRLEKQGSLLTARPFPTHFPGPSAPRRPLGRHRRLAAARRTQRRTAPVRPDPIPYRSGDTALDLLQRCGRRYAHAVRFQY